VLNAVGWGQEMHPICKKSLKGSFCWTLEDLTQPGIIAGNTPVKQNKYSPSKRNKCETTNKTAKTHKSTETQTH